MGRTDCMKSETAQTELEPKLGGVPSYRELLTKSPFGLMWTGQVVSVSGDFVFDVALSWLVWNTTHNPLSIGFVLFAFLLPRAIAGPLLGRWVDLVSKTRVLILSSSCQAIIIGLLAIRILLYGTPAIWEIIVAVMALGFAGRVYSLAFSASLPLVLEGKALVRANALSSVANDTNSVLTYAAAGIVVAVFGVTLSISYDAVTFVFVAVACSFIRSKRLSRIDSSGRPTFTLDGFRQLVGDRLLSRLLIIEVVLAFTGAAFYATLVLRVLVLSNSPIALGFLLAALPIGSLAGSVLSTQLSHRWSPPRAIGLGVLVSGIITLSMAVPTIVILIILLVGLWGVLVSITNVPLSSLLQSNIPEGSVGTVIGALVFPCQLGASAAAIIAAELFVAFGPVALLVLIGTMLAVLGVGVLQSSTLQSATLTPDTASH